MSTITPTVGRKVWFYENNWQIEPHDATIVKVWAAPEHATPTTCVNLLVIDPYTGVGSLKSSVAVGDEHYTGPHYRWMPYQVGQAKPAAVKADHSAAVVVLDIAAGNCETNAPIHEAEGNAEQAALSRSNAQKYRAAIDTLQG